MPRIELIPSDWNNSAAKASGDGTPTVDVCLDCARTFVEGEKLPYDVVDDLNENNDDDIEDDVVVGSISVDHPSYDEDGDDLVDCAVCGCGLTCEDD